MSPQEDFWNLQSRFRGKKEFNFYDKMVPQPFKTTPTPTSSITPTPTLTPTCIGVPESSKECLTISYVSGDTRPVIEGTYRFFAFAEYRNLIANLDCGCELTYAAYRKVDDPNVVLYQSNVSGINYAIINVTSGYLECDSTYSTGGFVSRNIPTENIGGKLYPTEGDWTFTFGGISFTYNITYVPCPTPTPTTTPIP